MPDAIVRKNVEPDQIKSVTDFLDQPEVRLKTHNCLDIANADQKKTIPRVYDFWISAINQIRLSYPEGQ